MGGFSNPFANCCGGDEVDLGDLDLEPEMVPPSCRGRGGHARRAGRRRVVNGVRNGSPKDKARQRRPKRNLMNRIGLTSVGLLAKSD